MATPSSAYPFSPSPSSPDIFNDAPSSPDPANAERRRSKRESTASATRRREEAATRYPSPPPVASPNPNSSSTSRRPTSIDASLVIPPFNPNNRRQSGTSSSQPSSGNSSRRNSQIVFSPSQPTELMPPPPSNVQYYPQQQPHQRPMSVAVPSSSSASSSPLIGSGAFPSSGASSSSATGSGAATGPASRVRQSVGYLPTSSTNQTSSLGPYPQLYTPHPMPKQKIYFGPYILLQTLGEGEFGKVKLGVHSERWGEDVAIKLIKRGNVDTAQRGEKVRREIEVLKAVRHPNIVRLYDVIETDKYIGIVLEYASGGELFDHILAHRYLKERDASRLFAQLISGVAYLHAKGIVHRDLKLENLLLDRNRNVQITDFGFANRFEDANHDLMATSCGSPCYAAPELVVQDGKYVGTAVDVWSCGVILYAMLAGYLPYDDDPANPEGDNINLLYKYIISTPLSFPEWISEEPRELLLLMLVPDPLKRCTIEDVMHHSWLRKFAPHFERTVEQLEKQAQEQEMWKRQALEAQRQFLVQQYAQQQAQAQAQAQQQKQAQVGGLGIFGTSGPGPQGMTRSQSHTMSAGPPSSGTRARSAMVQSATQSDLHAFPSSVKEEEPSSSVPAPASMPREPRTSIVLPFPPAANRRSGNASFGSTSPTTVQTQRISVDADRFSFEPRSSSSGKNSPIPSPSNTVVEKQPVSAPMIPSFSAPPDPPSTKPQDDLMVVDVASRRTSTSSRSSRRSSTTAAAVPISTTVVGTGATIKSPTTTTQATMTNAAAEQRNKVANRATAQVKNDEEASKRRAEKESPVTSKVVKSENEDVVMDERIDIPSTPTEPESIVVGSAPVEAKRSTTPPLVPLPDSAMPSTPSSDSNSNSTPKKRKSSGEANPSPPKDLPPVPVSAASSILPSAPATPTRSRPDADATPRAKKASTPASTTAKNQVPASPASSVASRARIGTDRFSLRGLLSGSSPDSTPRKESSSTTRKEAQSSTTTTTPTALEEVTNNRRKSRRQKAMSLQPFKSGSMKSSKPPPALADLLPPIPTSASTTRIGGTGSSSSTTASNREQNGLMGPPSLPSSSANKPTTRSSVAAVAPSTTTANRDLEAGWSSGPGSVNQQPAGKAKAVMDWFRRRSTRASGPTEAAMNQSLTTELDRTSTTIGTRRPRPMSMMTPSSSRASSTLNTANEKTKTPSVVVNSGSGQAQRSSPQSSRSTSGGNQSQSSHQTSSTIATSVISSGGSTVMAPSSRQQVESKSTATSTPVITPPVFVATKLRVHQGALDKHALTYRSPPDVMIDIRNALWSLGVDFVPETEYKLKCVRKSRKKAQLAQQHATTGLGFDAPLSNDRETLLNSSLSSRISNSPSITSNLTASPSMTFRGFFARKNSSTPLGSPALGASPAMTSSSATGSSNNAQGVMSPDLLQSPVMTPSLSSTLHSHTQGLGAQAQPQPIYGEGSGSRDQGDEVRFHVEMTRVKHLERLYCVDLKRVKGDGWSYKHVYDQLLGALELGPS